MIKSKINYPSDPINKTLTKTCGVNGIGVAYVHGVNCSTVTILTNLMLWFYASRYGVKNNVIWNLSDRSASLEIDWNIDLRKSFGLIESNFILFFVMVCISSIEFDSIV